MKKLTIAVAVIIASASAFADNRSDKIGAGLLGALIGAVAAQAANADAPQAAPAVQPLAQPQSTIGVPFDPRQQAEYFEIAKQTYVEHRGDVNYTPYAACREAAKRFSTSTPLKTNECYTLVKPLYDERMAENEAAIERNRADRTNAMKATTEAIVARVRNGETKAQHECKNVNDNDIRNSCIQKTVEAHLDALKSKKAEPADCREWQVANGLEKTLSIGLKSKGSSGSFTGIVKEINGDLVSIYNSMTHDIAVINTLGSKIIEGGGRSITLESVVVGYGTQVKSMPGQRANGAATSIAIIKGACISPAPFGEVIGNLIQRGY